MTLSVLICTVERRRDHLRRLLRGLKHQARPGVEVLVEDGDETIGAKRNRLLQRALGQWVAFVDDDDQVSPGYIDRLLNALAANPDCVGFKVLRTVDGEFNWLATHSLANARYEVQGPIAWRPANHLNPIRREIAIQFPFKEMLDRGEDYDFAMRIRDSLKREVFIDKVLYHYDSRG